MDVRFRYEISGPPSEDLDALDYIDVPSIEELRFALMDVMTDHVSWGVFPNQEDLELLWAEIEKARGHTAGHSGDGSPAGDKG